MDTPILEQDDSYEENDFISLDELLAMEETEDSHEWEDS